MTAGQKAAATRARRRQLQAGVVDATRVDNIFDVPVSFKGDACRQSDATSLPQTVYLVADRECRWYVVGHCYWHESETARSLNVAPLVTYLPANYFVGHPAMVQL